MDLRDILKTSSLPRPETEILLAFLLNKSREFLLTHPETPISPSIYRKFKALEAKRRQNWPIAYLIGVKEFYGLDFKVNPAVLTPRPETEMMVEDIVEIAKDSKAIEKTSNSKKTSWSPSLKPIIIDLGTGSGAIVISIAKELKRLAPSVYRRAEFLAVDISAPALKMAKKNAAHHGLAKKIKFYRGNLLSPLKLGRRDLSKSEIIIAANLPYLTPTQIKKSPSIRREPRLALDGGADGLKYYRELFKQLSALTIVKNTKSYPIGDIRVICEIDDSQAKKIKALAKKNIPQIAYKVARDLSGKKRFFYF